jgi:hypothetical protein
MPVASTTSSVRLAWQPWSSTERSLAALFLGVVCGKGKTTRLDIGELETESSGFLAGVHFIGDESLSFFKDVFRFNVYLPRLGRMQVQSNFCGSGEDEYSAGLFVVLTSGMVSFVCSNGFDDQYTIERLVSGLDMSMHCRLPVGE